MTAAGGFHSRLQGIDAGLADSWHSLRERLPTVRSAQRCRWLAGCLIAALAALVLFPDLNQPLADTDEGRQAEVPREMLAAGDLLTPRFSGAPYFEKPPLQYWLTAAAYSTFGVHPWTARLVPALAAWFAVLAAYGWACGALGRRAAFLGAAALCLCPGFVVLGRTAVLDSLLGACVIAAWFTAERAVRGTRLHRGWWLVSAVCCGLGLLTKGPVALALLVPPVFVLQMGGRQAARPRLLAWLGYGIVALSLAVPWYALMGLHQPGYLQHFLWRDNVLRFLAPFDHQQPWWFYAPVLFAGTFPWSLLGPWLAYFLFTRNRRLAKLRTSGLWFCVLIATWGLGFYSLSGCKSPPYLAPVLPPLALLAGACVDAAIRRVGRHDRFFARARQDVPRWATGCVLVSLLICASAAGLLGWQSRALTVGETAATVLAGVLWLRYGRRARPIAAWGICALATLALVVLVGKDLGTGFATRHSLRAAAHVARHLPNIKGWPLVAYRRTWLSALFYFRRDRVPTYEEGQRPALLAFLRTAPGALVLVEQGPPLDELLDTIPPSWDTTVHLPEREGQAALVVIRQRIANASATGRDVVARSSRSSRTRAGLASDGEAIFHWSGLSSLLGDAQLGTGLQMTRNQQP